LIPGQAYGVKSVKWPFGYGSLEHDDIPEFFQPIATLVPTAATKAELKGNRALGSLIEFKVYVYDDTVGILIAEWAAKPSPDTSYDKELTNLTNLLVAHVVDGAFQPLLTALQDAGRPSDLWRDLKKVAIYRDISDSMRIPKQALWVARTVFLPEQSENFDDWLSWAGMQNEDMVSTGTVNLYIGSGNTLLSDLTDENQYEDFIRAMCICQFYAALLSIYQDRLLTDLKSLELDNHLRNQRHRSTRILRDVERRLDHLDWIRLKHEQSLYGTQSIRRIMVKAIHSSWETESQFQNIKGWIDLLRGRISRQARNKQIRQARLIRTLLAVIGGLSIIDLALLLTKDSREIAKDSIPGILDAFEQIPPDAALYTAVALLILISAITRRGDTQ